MNKNQQKALIKKLVNIKNSIQKRCTYKALEEYLEALEECMKEMKEAKFHEDLAEVFLTAINNFKEGKITQSQIAEKLTIFIKLLKLEANPVKAEICEEVYNEFKSAYHTAVAVAQKNYKKVQDSFEANKPKYVEKVNEAKVIAKNMERKLKRGIRNWLKEDGEE